MSILISKSLLIWLVVGQSNVVGTDIDGTSKSTVDFDGKILFYDFSGSFGSEAYNSNGWTSFKEYNGGFGPERGFARRYVRFRPNFGDLNVGIVKIAWNGERIAKFYDSGETDYWTTLKAKVDDAVASAKDLGYSVSIEGLIFLQGTDDALNEADANAYQSRLEALIASYRAEWNPNMLVAVADHPADFNTSTYRDTVQAAFAAVAASDPNVYIVSTSEAEDVGDNVHYTSESKELIGIRMANAILKL